MFRRNRPRRSPVFSVALTFESQDRVGTGFNGAVDSSRKVNAEKRELRIGNRIDQIPDERSSGRSHLVVFAAKRNDSYFRVGATDSRHTVALQTAAIHKSFAKNIAGSRGQYDRTVLPAATNNTRTGFDSTALIGK